MIFVAGFLFRCSINSDQVQTGHLGFDSQQQYAVSPQHEAVTHLILLPQIRMISFEDSSVLG